MTGSHREVERKLDVDAAFVLPDLGSVAGVASVDPPVEHALEAVYHDTSDLRLARARVTLRRRTGGADAGWHLKLPGDRGARQEVHAPLGRAAKVPPKALRELVLGITRGTPTEPVATLRTRRVATVVRDVEGRALAEVADDTVHGTALPPGEGLPAGQSTWREVEVELVDGDEDLLARLVASLTDAGASPATAASKAGRVLADRVAGLPGAPRLPVLRTKKGKQRPTGADVVLAAVRAQVEALRTADLMVRTSEPDGVHKFRVACRRLRSILAAFRSVLDRTVTDPLREELRWLGEQLSDARDGEVALAHLRELVAEQPPEQVPGPVAARLQQTALKEEAKGSGQAARTLRHERYLRLLDALEALLADPPLVEDAGEPADRVLVAGIRRTTKRLLHRIDDARQASPENRAHTLHEVRKAAKRVRYTGEVAEGIVGRRAAALVSCAKDVQEVLGAHQDTEVTRSWCERLGRGAFAAGENPWAFGRLHALEEARAARAREEFWELEPSLHPVLKAARKKG